MALYSLIMFEAKHYFEIMNNNIFIMVVEELINEANGTISFIEVIQQQNAYMSNVKQYIELFVAERLRIWP